MIRFTYRFLLIVGGLLICLPLHYSWRLLARRSPWPRHFLGWAGRSAGLRVTVAGTPLTSHVLFVANHESWLDIMGIAGATGASFVSKAEVGRWPVVGWLANLNQTVYVERADRKSVHSQADALRATLASGRPVALFPEGTIGDGPIVLPFRASLFAALYPPLPGIRIQPVAIDYGSAATAITWTGDEGAGANARRVLARLGTIPLVIRFLEPIDPGAVGDRKALAERARAEIVAALGSARPDDRL